MPLLLAGAVVGWRLRQRAKRIGSRRTDFSSELGRGLVSGFAGTVAITAAGAIEQWWKARAQKESAAAKPSPSGGSLGEWFVKVHEPWLFAADGASKTLGVKPVDDRGRQRLGIAAHWLYGIGWGLAAGMLHLVHVRGAPLAGALLAGQLGAEFVAMPRAKFFPPAREWGRDAILASVRDHSAYALAAAATMSRLSRA